MLAFIYDRLRERLSGYFARLLSQGGKEVLLKAVAMAMPVYAMSCFKLTKQACENLTRAMADFWWNSLEHKRKIHWLSWTKLCLAKEQGGLGFKDIQDFNQALLAKQAWRLLQYPDSLFAMIFKSRYYNSSEFLEATLGSRPSYAWRSIQFGKDLLLQGLRKEVGDGVSVYVWMDQWIVGEPMRRPLMKNIFVDLELKVCSLIDPVTKTWDPGILSDLFFDQDIESIMKMKPITDESDFWVWMHNRNGSYSVKSGYWLKNRLTRMEEIREAVAEPSLNILKAAVWKTATSPKIQIFMWKTLCNAIPAGDLIIKRGIKMDHVCQTCGHQGESVNHIIFTCPIARLVWALANIPTPQGGFDERSYFSNFHHLLEQKEKSVAPKKWYVCFHG